MSNTTLAHNIVQRARLLAALDPAVLAELDHLDLMELDYQIEDVCTALARRGLIPNEGLFEPSEEEPMTGPDMEYEHESALLHDAARDAALLADKEAHELSPGWDACPGCGHPTHVEPCPCSVETPGGWEPCGCQYRDTP